MIVKGIPVYTKTLRNKYLSNTSICKWRDKFVIVFRHNDYYIQHPESLYKLKEGNESIISIGYISDLDFSEPIEVVTEVLPQESQYEYEINSGEFMNRFTGREDMRLVVWGDELYGYCSRPDIIENKVVIELLKFDEELNIEWSVVLDTGEVIEKNWQAVEDQPFTWVYWNNPLKVLRWYGGDGGVYISDQNIDNYGMNIELDIGLKGSSQLVRYRDGYISVCHSSQFPWYTNHLVFYDNSLKIIDIINFKTTNNPTEFVCGLCKYNDSLYMTVTDMDTSPYILRLDIEDSDMIYKDGVFGRDMDVDVVEGFNKDLFINKLVLDNQPYLSIGYANKFKRWDVMLGLVLGGWLGDGMEYGDDYVEYLYDLYRDGYGDGYGVSKFMGYKLNKNSLKEAYKGGLPSSIVNRLLNL